METQWLADLESADAKARSLALQKLKKLGPEARTAVPALITALEKAGDDRDLAVAIAATLGAIGPDARDAVPLLVPLVNPDIKDSFWGRGNLEQAILVAILQIGGEPDQERLALGKLLQLQETRGWDAYPLELWRWNKPLMQSRADRIIPRLAELLTDADEYVRARACETLAGYGSQAASIAPALVAALNHPSPGVRIHVAQALVAVAPDRKSEAIAALIAVLSHPEGLSNYTAQGPGYSIGNWSVCSALSQLGGDPVPHLVSLLRQHTGPEQMPYIQALQAIGEPSVPALRQELRGASVAGRAGAARTLGLVAGSEAALEDLALLLQDPDAEVRGEAAQSLVTIDAVRADAALPHLIARLESADATARARVIQLLVRLGPAAEPALPALIRLLTDPGARLEAALALVAINARQAAPAVRVLVDALVDALERYDPAAPAPVQLSAFLAALGWAEYWNPESSSAQLHTVLEALGRIGSAAAVAAPNIRQAQRSRGPGGDENVRVSAAKALVRVAPELTTEAATTLTHLVEEASDPGGSGDPTIIMIALSALAAIGPAAGDCVPRLEAILLDEVKRRMWDPGLLFSTLVRLDGTAAARVRAHIEADLQSNDCFDKAVGLVTDLRSEFPATWAPLLESLLQDQRAENQWDSIRYMLDGLGVRPAGG